MSACTGIDAFDGEPLSLADQEAFERDWIPQETWWQVLRARRLLRQSSAPTWDSIAKRFDALAAAAAQDFATAISPTPAGLGLAGLGFTHAAEAVFFAAEAVIPGRAVADAVPVDLESPLGGA